MKQCVLCSAHLIKWTETYKWRKD